MLTKSDVRLLSISTSICCIALFFGKFLQFHLSDTCVYSLFYEGYRLQNNSTLHTIAWYVLFINRSIFIALPYNIGTLLFYPIVEEIEFRGFVLLFKRKGGLQIVMAACSSLLFVICHNVPIGYLPPIGLMGGLSSILAIRTGKILPSILLHIAYNGLVLVMF